MQIWMERRVSILLLFSILFISSLRSNFKVNLSEVKSKMKKNYVNVEKCY